MKHFSLTFRSLLAGATVSLLSLSTTVQAGAQSLGASAGSAFGSMAQSANNTTYTPAGRMLNQTTFGPTPNEILSVTSTGIQSWLQSQLNTPAYLMPVPIPAADYTAGDCDGWSCAPEYWWWQDILWGQDQLRQRVAYALSKLFVVSMQDVDARYFPYYLNVLSKDAFANWQTLMMDVSQSSAMGLYLNSANSLYTPNGPHADENFSREMMQLFSIGVYALNNDGTLKTDSNGNPIPNYTAAQVQDLGRAFTGWTLAEDDDGTNGCPTPSHPIYSAWGWPYGETCPMVPLAQYHDPGQKTLLRGTVLPAGQSPQQDWSAAIANVFNDPSLPPFVCKRLIQNLVKSNPSPAYVNRIANVFINDGTGTRGNMSAVISAMLLDQEAREDDNGGVADPNTGLMRDPVLLYTSILRGLMATDPASFPYTLIYSGRLDLYLQNLSEQPHAAPSVFSFYSPTNTITLPGTNTTLLAPEFELENTMTVPWMIGHIQDAINSNWNWPSGVAPEMVLDLSATSAYGQVVTQYGIGELIWALNQVLMHGTMSTQMQQAILNGIAYDTNVGDQVRDAVFLIVTSPEYRIMI